MNNSGLIIFSRLDSSRLPQKALKKIGKKNPIRTCEKIEQNKFKEKKNNHCNL